MQRKKISFVILSAILGLGTLLSGCGEKKLHRQLRVIRKASLASLQPK